MTKGTNTLNKTDQREAVNRTFLLVKDGNSITEARKIVATELDVSPNTLWVWQRKFNLVTPNISRKTSLVSGGRTVTRTVEYTFGDMSHDVRGIMRSIVNQDGRYTIKEANVVGKLYGSEISAAKLKLEFHKHNTKLSSKANNNHLISLT